MIPLRKILLVISLLTFLPLYASGETLLMNGEMVVKKDGTYTKGYNYWHPKSKRTVMLYGTIHWAEPSYYQFIQFLLERCEYVIYEGPPGARKIPAEQAHWYKDLIRKEKLAGEDLDRMFEIADMAFPPNSQKLFGFQEERTAWDYTVNFEGKAKRWISGDNSWFMHQQQNSWQEFWSGFREKIKNVPLETRMEVALRTHEFFFKVEHGTATKKDYVQWLAFLYGNGREARDLRWMRDYLTAERDKIVFKDAFDNIIRLTEPKSICLKFGTYHMGHQRAYLEERGYKLKYIQEIKAVNLP